MYDYDNKGGERAPKDEGQGAREEEGDLYYDPPPPKIEYEGKMCKKDGTVCVEGGLEAIVQWSYTCKGLNTTPPSGMNNP